MDSNKKANRYNGRKYMITAIITIVVTLSLIVASPFIAKWGWLHRLLNLTHPNEVGDTIGGITAPIIGFGAAILVFLSFWAQYQANQRQWDWIEQQEEEKLFERIQDLFKSIHTEYKEDFDLVFASLDEEFKGINHYSMTLYDRYLDEEHKLEIEFLGYEGFVDEVTIFSKHIVQLLNRVNILNVLIDKVLNSRISETFFVIILAKMKYLDARYNIAESISAAESTLKELEILSKDVKLSKEREKLDRMINVFGENLVFVSNFSKEINSCYSFLNKMGKERGK